MSDRALKACQDYARINAEIKALSRELSDALSKCRGVMPEQNSEPFFVAASETHLKRLYSGVVEDHPFEPSIRYLSDKEIRARLMNECGHCLAAHVAIQMRKAARRKLGATKAFITKIGKEAR